MLYCRFPIFAAYEDTGRKRLGVLRHQQRQRDALPLFADLIAASQPSVDTVMIERAEQAAKFAQQLRNNRAAYWRKVRAVFYAMPPVERAKIRQLFELGKFAPRDPRMYSYYLREAKAGRLDDHLTSHARAVETGKIWRIVSGLEPANDTEKATARARLDQINAENRAHFNRQTP